MEPIKLTPENDYLIEYDAAQPREESDCLTSCIGSHHNCGWMDVMGRTETHKAILCRKCFLRIVIPNTVETYADLRKYCEEKEETK